METSWLIRGGKVITPEEVLSSGVVVLHKGRIVYVGTEETMPEVIEIPGSMQSIRPDTLPLLDATDHIVAPGFIDIHVHGGGGADTMDVTPEAIRTIARAHAAHGTTGFLPTSMTAAHEPLLQVASVVKRAIEETHTASWSGAVVLGLHLEGPYIDPERVGAQNPAFVRQADVVELAELYDVLGEYLQHITIAPEREGAREAITWLIEHGISVSMGHTGASYEQAWQSMEYGVSHVTHAFNAMTPLHHRAPGVVGAMLSHPRVTTEVIADGIHVHNGVLRLLYQAKGPEKLCLITDAIEAMGMPDGQYELGGLPVFLRDGQCRLESGALAGSVLTMDEAIRRMVQEIDVDIVSAVRMASLTPAEVIGIDDEYGSLSAGKRGDIVLLNEALQCEKTLVAGKVVFQR